MKILIYNSGGGLGDSIQLFDIIYFNNWQYLFILIKCCIFASLKIVILQVFFKIIKKILLNFVFFNLKQFIGYIYVIFEKNQTFS